MWMIACAIVLYLYPENQIVQSLNAKHTPFLDGIFCGFTAFGQYQLLVTVVVSWLIFIPRLRSRNFILSVLLVYTSITCIVYGLKYFFATDRPLNVISNLYRVPTIDHAFHNGMPSGHTTTAFAFVTLVFALFKMPHFARVVLIIFAIGCGLSRVYLAQHFLSDVLAGTALGLALGLILSKIIKKYLPY
ncbi:MAG: hypothetical protein RL660_554 [Bacteroidota bacterium]|jgi:undecaprenyl-diphosphatase